MTTQALIAIIVALLLPGVLYISVGFRVKKQITDVFQYLPLERYLHSHRVSATIVAAGMSMATVMVALINLAPLVGIALFWTVITFSVGFFLLHFAVERIMRLNPKNLVLQSFLGEQYSSTTVRTTATIFSIIGYLSIFSMEILVSVAILKPFFGDWVLSFAIVYLAFVLIYTGLSGFRGIVETDRLQLSFIVASLGALIVLALLVAPSDTAGTDWIITQLSTWHAPAAFMIGIAFMNIPAPFSDVGTWQRVCAAESSKMAAKGLLTAAMAFFFIWGALIICGIILSASPNILAEWQSDSDPLITGILTFLGRAPLVYTILLFVLIAGLFSAMISTADSLLIAATQMSLSGFQSHERLHNDPRQSLRYARWLVIGLGMSAFALFLVFNAIGLNVVQLVFAIYGAQLALFPTTAAALFLYQKVNMMRLRFFATGSICTGFLVAWATALYGHVSESLDLQFYAPAFGLLAATIVLLAGLSTVRGRR